jgi:hypothetical protein
VLTVLVDQDLDATDVRQRVVRNEEDLHPAMRDSIGTLTGPVLRSQPAMGPIGPMGPSSYVSP